MPEEEKTIQVKHPDWMGIVVKTIGTVLFGVLAVGWYFAEMSIVSKDKLISVEGDMNHLKGEIRRALENIDNSQTSKLNNEIQRSEVEDKDIRKDVEENKQTLKRVLEYAIRQDEAKKYLHKE